MSRHLRDILKWIDYLGDESGPRYTPLSGGKARPPLHVWAASEVGEACARCHLQRFMQDSRRYGASWLYQRPNGQLRMGVEPGCVKRGRGP